MKLSVYKDNQELMLKDLGIDFQDKEQVSSIFIGRGKDCFIRLDNRKISREHAQILFESGQWKIKNTSNHKNSLKINGLVTQEKVLEESDFINIGPYEINISGLEEVKIVEVPIKEPEPEVQESSVEEVEPEGPENTEDTVVESDEETESEGIEAQDEDNEDDPFGNSSYDENNEEEKDESFESSDSDNEYDENEGGGFEDGGFEADSGGDSFAMESAGGSEETQEIRLASYTLFLEGENIPFSSLLLENGETLIGRNPEKCKIILDDAEVSSEHVKIKKTKIDCILEDLNSSNGTLINGNKIKTAELTDGDSFQVGKTLFTLKIDSDFLAQQKDMLMPVEQNQEIEVEEIVEVATDFGDEEGFEEGEAQEGGKKQSLLEQIKKDPVKRKRAIMVGGVLVLLLFLMDTDPPKKKTTVVKKDSKVANTKMTKGKDKKDEKPKFTPEQTEFLEASYLLSKELFQTGKYRETLIELQKIFNITKEYKNAKQIYSLAKQGLAKLEEIERKRKEEIERKKRERRTQELVKRARKATDEKKFDLAKTLFTDIMKLDPENYDVPQMKLEIDSYLAEQKRIKDEKERAIQERNEKVAKLGPSKKFYFAKDWYRSIIKLQQFLQIQPMDDDLVQEANKMLEESKDNLNGQIIPLLAKARSLGEGEDLKGAYEIYNKVLFHDPGNAEALEEMGRIKDLLHNRAKKIYRHAIIAESLSLFDDAKEKFQEVQQISPSDSEYFKKASKKLSEYIE